MPSRTPRLPRSDRPPKGRPPILIKRAYDPPAPEDGRRILVDRYWPRGLTKEKARLDGWFRELAPSDDLRKWYHHDPTRFEEFQARYRRELLPRSEGVAALLREAAGGPLTLVFSARVAEGSNAFVLREILEEERRHPHASHPDRTRGARRRVR